MSGSRLENELPDIPRVHASYDMLITRTFGVVAGYADDPRERADWKPRSNGSNIRRFPENLGQVAILCGNHHMLEFVTGGVIPGHADDTRRCKASKEA